MRRLFININFGFFIKTKEQQNIKTIFASFFSNFLFQANPKVSKLTLKFCNSKNEISYSTTSITSHHSFNINNLCVCNRMSLQQRNRKC